MSANLSALLKPAATTEWETPQDFFDALNEDFGFTLDVCASAINAKCSRFFSPEVDGLSQSWAGEVCWMNPPYGPAIKMVARLRRKCLAANVHSWALEVRRAQVECTLSERSGRIHPAIRGRCVMTTPQEAAAVAMTMNHLHWMRKAYEESLKGATVVCLVPARTDTANLSLPQWKQYTPAYPRRVHTQAVCDSLKSRPTSAPKYREEWCWLSAARS